MPRVKEINDTADARADNPSRPTDHNHCGTATAENLAGCNAAGATGCFCSTSDDDWIDRMLSRRARAW
jgi:hypothetical protein